MASTDFRFSPRPNKAADIQWREWSDAAFQEAAAAGKPVLLSISAVWCHWCHVMDETSYSDDENIRAINEGFVPIRVDNDRRPDINARYNQGGWPTTAFLTPEGEILAGTTYLPPDRLKGVLDQVREYYTGNREEVEQKVQQIRARREVAARREGSLQPPTAALVTDIVTNIRDAYDETYGGLGNEPKFPHPEAFNLLLDQYVLTNDLPLLLMVTNTLDQMRSRGIWDKVEGGFFRYSTTKDWEIPHFEKMLEGEAGLLGNYLYAFRVTGDASYQRVAKELMAYLNRTLFDYDDGFFYGTQDADEHYFSLDASERAKLQAPFVDRTLYVNWNGLMAAKYLEAAWTLNDVQTLTQAQRVLNFLWAHCREDEAAGGGMYHYHEAGTPKITGLLTDQVCVALAELGAYDATGDRTHLQRAQHLAGVIEAGYHDTTGGGFYDLRGERDALGNLQFRTKNIEENGDAAHLFLRLHAATGNDHYRELADSALRAFAVDYPHYGYFGSGYARAFIRSTRPALDAHVVGDRSVDATRNLLWGVLKLSEPNKAVLVVDPQADADQLDELGYPSQPSPAVYLCHSGTCSAPVEDAAGLAAASQNLASPVRRL